MKAIAPLLCCVAVLLSAPVRADIFRWDNGQLIPGTEGITPGPGVQLDHRQLAFAGLNARNLTDSSFEFSNLSSATFRISTLTNANLSGANLSNAELRAATLTNANLDGAVVTGAVFNETTAKGFTKEQLYSTASYQSKNLQGIQLGNNNLEGWDFSGQNLTNARLSYFPNANLNGANLTNALLSGQDMTNAGFTGAVIKGAKLADTTTRGFTTAQLYSTASYAGRDLAGISLDFNDLTGWDLHGQNLAAAVMSKADLTGTDLSGANLSGAKLDLATFTNADLSDAIIAAANFDGTTLRGFTATQLYSTASHQAKNLQGIQLRSNDLTGWDFSDQNLTAAAIAGTLTNADFSGATVKRASLGGISKEQLYSTASYEAKNLEAVELFGDLSGWDLRNQNLANARFSDALLVDSDFSGATMTDTYFRGVHISGANAAGAKFSNANLARANLEKADLTNANFQGADLQGARLYQAKLAGAEFSGAHIQGAILSDTTVFGFTKEQLYSTASYQARDLRRVDFGVLRRPEFPNNFTAWNFHNQNLTDANFNSATIADADFSGAVIEGVKLPLASRFGFTKEMLYSTASYQMHDLRRLNLTGANLAAWDLHSQNLAGAMLANGTNLTDSDLSDANLTGVNFSEATLTNANLAGAVIAGANLGKTTPKGFTKEQLYSTASHQAKQLGPIDLTFNDLSGWNFHGQQMKGANLFVANLTGANLSGAYLKDANLLSATLANADLSGAVIAGAKMLDTTPRGFTKEQLYSTASYQSRNLVGIKLAFNDLTGWDFNGQYMADGEFQSSTLTGADFRQADLRGAIGWSALGVITGNTIRPDGSVDGLDLTGGKRLVARNFYGNLPESISIAIQSEAIFDSGILELQFDSGNWNSRISFEPGISVNLGGKLELAFADGMDIVSQVGRTFHIFDWTGVSPTGAFTVASRFPWDVSELYSTGEVTLLLPGDTNGDQAVTLEDLNNVRNNFGGTGTGDTNNDGVVDLVDLNNVRNFFGASTPQAVPEPASLVLAVLTFSVAALCLRRAT